MKFFTELSSLLHKAIVEALWLGHSFIFLASSMLCLLTALQIIIPCTCFWGHSYTSNWEPSLLDTCTPRIFSHSDSTTWPVPTFIVDLSGHVLYVFGLCTKRQKLRMAVPCTSVTFCIEWALVVPMDFPALFSLVHLLTARWQHWFAPKLNKCAHLNCLRGLKYYKKS
jgi:hypothetical protein